MDAFSVAVSMLNISTKGPALPSFRLIVSPVKSQRPLTR